MSTVGSLIKAELHRHLELCLRPDTIWELAPQFGIPLKSQREFQERFMILEPMKDLGTVLNKFLDTQKLLANEEILERISFEACEDAFKNDGIRILELRYAPTFIQLGHQLTFEQIHEAIVRGVRKAEAQYPMAVGLIATVQRILPVAEGKKVIDFAIAHKDTFVGVDLADNEEGFDSKPFAPLFLKAQSAGLGITIHSGEAPHPKAPKWVMDAVEVLHAVRIGHGVQIIQSPEVMAQIRDRGVVLELCPTSNMLTNAIPDLKQHPLRKLMEAGIKVTVNTDDPGIFNTNLNREYRIAHEILGMTLAELDVCSQTAAEASFIPKAKRAKVWPKPLAK